MISLDGGQFFIGWFGNVVAFQKLAMEFMTSIGYILCAYKSLLAKLAFSALVHSMMWLFLEFFGTKCLYRSILTREYFVAYTICIHIETGWTREYCMPILFLPYKGILLHQTLSKYTIFILSSVIACCWMQCQDIDTLLCDVLNIYEKWYWLNLS